MTHLLWVPELLSFSRTSSVPSDTLRQTWSKVAIKTIIAGISLIPFSQFFRRHLEALFQFMFSLGYSKLIIDEYSKLSPNSKKLVKRLVS